MATSSSSSTSPSHFLSPEKKRWWLSTKKVVDKHIREARVMMSTREETEINSALSQLEAALVLSPRCEDALELKSRCLLFLRRYKEVANMLQDYIPSYKITVYSDDSSGSSSDNSSQNVKLLRLSELHSPAGCEYSSHRCFSVSDLKKKVLAGIYKNSGNEGHWRYMVLGQACCHLGLMEDAMVLLQHGKRLATAAFRRESICLSDDSFSFSVSSSETAVSNVPLAEAETITNLICYIKLILRRRAAALAALDAGLYSESIRHFSKILDGRRPAPQAFLAECYLYRSAAFKAAGRVAESISDLNRTLALDHNSTAALLARAGLFEMIGCITDSVHDLEHVRLIYNSILRDRKLPGPCWKPRTVSHREIPGRLCSLGSKIKQLKQKIAMGEIGSVDYYALIGLRRGCSRSELDRAHLLLVLKHKPEKSIGFLDRCEFADEMDFDSIKDRARMSAVLLFRLIKKGYSSLSSAISKEAEAEKELGRVALALRHAQVQLERERQDIIEPEPEPESEPEPEPEPEPEIDIDRPDDKACLMSGNGVGTFAFQGIFCRDLAVVGSLLSQAGYDRPLTVKFEGLSC